MKKIILGSIACSSIAFAGINLGVCKGCHGQNWEKSALGKSKIVMNLTKKDVEKALVGYKNGTYGGPMAGVMKAQVSKYTEEELRNIGLGL